MKHKILFSVILILTIAAGLKITSLTSSILSRNDRSNTVISREDIKSDAVYINSTDTFSFAPFSMIDEKTAVPLRSNDKVIGKLHLSDIINTLFTFYCSYSEDTAFIKPVGKSLTDSVMIDEYDLLYVKGFAYYNNYGHIRYADFIFTEYNFSIIYLNFYDDTDIQLSGSDIEKAVINAGEYYENFSEGIKNHEITSWIFAEPFTIGGADELEWNAEWSDLTEEYMIYDVMYSDRDEVKYSLENMLKTASYNIYSSDSYTEPDPYSKFFRHIAITSLIQYIHSEEIPESERYIDDSGEYQDHFDMWESFDSDVSLLYCISDPSFENEPSTQVTEYSALKGRIYQAITMPNNKKLIIIFNPKTQLPEGIFTDNEW